MLLHEKSKPWKDKSSSQCRKSINGKEVNGGGVALLLHRKYDLIEIDLTKFTNDEIVGLRV